jgi:hypothetical protein
VPIPVDCELRLPSAPTGTQCSFTEHVSNALLEIEDSFIGLYLRKMIKIIMGKENGEEATDFYQSSHL